METKRASEIFGQVDPHLTVIDRHTGRRAKASDWRRSGGELCPRCLKEAVRFRPRDGVCVECVRVISEKEERDIKKRAKQLKFITQHNARIIKRKGANK